MSPADDRRPGQDTSLHALYDLVPDAYELDLLEEARRAPRPERTIHDGEPHDPDGPAPSVTQACFVVERLLGGVVVDDEGH